MKIRLQSNVPIPRPARGPGSAKYPWGRMKVGQSFFVSAATKDGVRPLIKAIVGSFRSWAKTQQTKRRYTARSDLKKRGVRVWRVA